MEPIHPITQLKENARKLKDSPALYSFLQDGELHESFQLLTWSQAADRCFRMASALKRRGVKRGDRVAMMLKNQSSWVLLDWAILSLGAVSVPLFVQTQKKELEFILKESEAKLFVSDRSLHELSSGHLSLAELEKESEGLPPLLEKELDLSAPHDLCTLIYTSGTTGEPKGVMHSVFSITEAVRRGRELADVQVGDRLISYLPLSHVAERFLSEFIVLYCGACCYFVDQVEKLPQALPKVQPHFFLGVPRVWDLFKNKISQGLEAKRQKWFFRWIPAETFTRLMGPLIKKKMGFSECKLFASGAAKLNLETFYFLQKLGIEVVEGYGLTETMAVVCFNRVGNNKAGTVGIPFNGVDVRLAEDGEVMIRASHLFQAYYKKPEETEAVLKDSWFATGDIGTQDAEGRLSITDRKKDIFKNSGGKYIAPLPIELELKKHPSVQEALVVGENQDHLVALCAMSSQNINKADLEAHLSEVNKNLPAHERLKRLACLEDSWSVEGGHLTPTMKIRRKVLQELYQEEIEALYKTREKILVFKRASGSQEGVKRANSGI